MRFSIERSIFLEGILNAISAVSSKSSLPALEGFLIEANEELKITGYDLETGIIVTLEANIDKTGSIIVNAQTLSEIIKKLPDDTVTFSVDDDLKIEIKCGMSKFNIIGIPALEFPDLPTIEYKKSIKLPSNLLKSMIKQTVYAVSTNENKPIHTGCLFEINGNIINVVGVDGYRLALRREQLNEEYENTSVVIPGKSLNKLLRMLDDSDIPVVMNISDKHAIFENENIIFLTRILEGEFLNYKNAIPTNFPIRAIADVKNFTESIDRASLLINERQRSPIRLNFDKDEVNLLCISPLGRIEDKILIKSNGGQIEIGFNNKYLLEAFKNTEREEVCLELKDSLSPMVIKPLEGESFTFLVLPVRLRNEE